MKLKIENSPSFILTTFLVFLFGIFIGVRDESVGSDTASYAKYFYIITESEQSRISEPLFFLLAKIVSLISYNPTYFFILISIISFSTLLLFYSDCAKLGGDRNKNFHFVFFACTFLLTIFSPFFINTQINVLRSGLSIPFLFFAGFHFYCKSYYKFITYSIIALGLHFSSILYIFSIILFLKFKPKSLFLIFLSGSAIYSLGVIEPIVLNFVTAFDFEFLNYYLRFFIMDAGYEKGVRFDFLFFTIFFGSIAFMSHLKFKTDLTKFLVLMYLASSIPFLAIGFMSYSDRLLLPPWFLIPLIVSNYISCFFNLGFRGFYFILALAPLFILISFFVNGLI